MALNGPGCCSKISGRKFALYVRLYLVRILRQHFPHYFQLTQGVHAGRTKSHRRRWGEGEKVGCLLANVNSPSPLPLPLPLATLAELSWSHGAQLSPFMPSSVSAAAATFPPNWSLSPQIGPTERADFGVGNIAPPPTLMIIVSDSKLDWRSSTSFD